MKRPWWSDLFWQAKGIEQLAKEVETGASRLVSGPPISLRFHWAKNPNPKNLRIFFAGKGLREKLSNGKKGPKMVVSGYIFWSFLLLKTWVLFKVRFYFLPWLCSLQKSPFFKNISQTLAKSMESWSSWLTCCFADSKPLSDCYFFFHVTTMAGVMGEDQRKETFFF